VLRLTPVKRHSVVGLIAFATLTLGLTAAWRISEQKADAQRQQLLEERARLRAQMFRLERQVARGEALAAGKCWGVVEVVLNGGIKQLCECKDDMYVCY
jgi:hypothetical protein